MESIVKPVTRAPTVIPTHRALKTGGVEVPREKWDEAEDHPDPGDVMEEDDVAGRSPANVIPDWTRTPLPVGAPPANPLPPQMCEATPLAVVGA